MNKYSLIDILTGEVEFEEKKYKFNGIQIPMIQRDYAHGREGESEIRKRFLKAVFSALENKNELELDFVYGTKKRIDNKELFIPLDGQQRLTTLYLLNWYIGNRELVNDKLRVLRKALESFSYATRVSSNKFCEILSSSSISFNVTPSKEIKNSSWFFDSFSLDPTVQSMLVMLDAIHVAYGKDKRALFSNLDQIRFYFLPLDGFDLTDELYIKMNARGKQLTQYENFKADLIKWVNDPSNPFKDAFHKDVEYDDRTVKYYLYFELKLDNHWTTLFWNHSKKYDKTEKKLVDPYMMQFWNRYLLNSHIVSSELNQDAIENDVFFKEFYGNKGDDSNIKYNNFYSYKTLLEGTNRIKSIEKVFESLVSCLDKVSEMIKPNWDKDDKWNLFSEDINQRQRIIFFAATKYLETNSFDGVKFKNWMRIVWNIIIDPDIRSISVMINIMRIVEKLSKGSGDIYKFLTSPALHAIIQNETSFAKGQLEEERLKAELIISDPIWESELISAEKHPLFQGSISFLLLNNPDISKFKHRLSVSKKLFSSKGTTGSFADEHLLLRAVISNIDDWNSLYEFNFGDDFVNWQLLLRRNPKVQLFISTLCDLKDEGAVISDISKKIASASNINGWSQEPLIVNKAKHIHRQLYQDKNLQIWIQDKEAVRLKWLNNHIYIHRPRSWYDRVALDTYRNEIAKKLITQFGFITTKQCDNANFYWGDEFQLSLLKTNFTIVSEFNEFDELRIGVRGDGKSNLPTTSIISPNDKEEGWLIRKKYTYTYANITDVNKVTTLINQIKAEVFDEKKKGSLINTII